MAEFSHTLALEVAYRGAAFSGFARQPEQFTVQGNLEDALRLLLRRDVETVCAGRTDAGVHALGQIVTFDVTDDEITARSFATLRNSLNALTHEDISVRSVTEKPFGFSARFDAKSREYHYHICTSDAAPMFMKDYSWHVHDALDVEAMRKAASYLIGEHDFKSFCLKASAEGKPTCRNVIEISITPETIMGEPILTIKVVGSSFLHSMVRTIVGTLVAIGRGKEQPEWMRDVLLACDRAAAGESAPAKGLVFWKVEY